MARPREAKVLGGEPGSAPRLFCRDCVHVESFTIGSGRYYRCTKGRWDKGGVRYLYAERTLVDNRIPIQRYGAGCPDFEARHE